MESKLKHKKCNSLPCFTQCLYFFKYFLKEPSNNFRLCLLFVNFLYEREFKRRRLAMNKGANTSTAVKLAACAVSAKTAAYNWLLYFQTSIFKLKVKTINEKLSCVCCIFNNFYPSWIISSQTLSHLWRWILCLISVKLWAYSNNAFPSRFSLMRREMWRHHITKTRYQALRCTSRSFNSW